MIIDDNGLARLAAMAHALRADWPSKSLQTYLREHAGRPYRDVAVALAWIAADPATQTPKRLDENGAWWLAAAAAEPAPATRTPTRVADMRCPRCERLVSTDRDEHRCGRLVDPSAIHGYADQARAAVRAAVAAHTGDEPEHLEPEHLEPEHLEPASGTDDDARAARDRAREKFKASPPP